MEFLMCMCVTKKKEGRKEDWEEREKGKSKEVENLLFLGFVVVPILATR
jgi:hypothetical protein